EPPGRPPRGPQPREAARGGVAWVPSLRGDQAPPAAWVRAAEPRYPLDAGSRAKVARRGVWPAAPAGSPAFLRRLLPVLTPGPSPAVRRGANSAGREAAGEGGLAPGSDIR